jgi:hypothetical protein
MCVLAEVAELARTGAGPHVIADAMRHARELVDIIEDEFAGLPSLPAAECRGLFAQLRSQLESLAQNVTQTGTDKKTKVAVAWRTPLPP